MSHINATENSDLRILGVVINGEDVNYLIDLSIVNVNEAVEELRKCGFTVTVKTVDGMSEADLVNHFHYEYFMDIGDIISSAVKISEITT